MKTKENAFTLPFSIALYEFMFFRSPDPLPHPQPLSLWERVAGGRVRGYRPLYLLPFALTLLVVPLSLLSFDKPVGEVIGSIESASRHYTATPRISYLFTQFRVLVTYLRLLFLPINQNFAYDYPVYNSFFNPQVLIPFLFLLSIFGLGVYLLYRSRSGNPLLRLLAWGIFWFFLTLSVESSIFPIPMIISEYRLYAPSMGVFLTVIAALFISGRQRLIIPALIAIALVFSGASYARNNVWKSRTGLWEDIVRKSPRLPKAHMGLGQAYRGEGLTDKAIGQYLIALRLKPNYSDVHNNLAIIYMSRGLPDKAIEHYRAAIRLRPDYADAHFNLGVLYLDSGLKEEARAEFEATLRINPNYHKARKWLNYLANKDKTFIPENRH